MPYQPNSPLYQTANSKVKSFSDFSDHKTEEKEELAKMKRNFTKRSEKHQIPGERKHKFNRVTHKIDDISFDETKDKLHQLEEKHTHSSNYMFFSNLKNICRMSREILAMDENTIDQMLQHHNWATDHIATSKDDVEEVYNWLRTNK